MSRKKSESKWDISLTDDVVTSKVSPMLFETADPDEEYLARVVDEWDDISKTYEPPSPEPNVSEIIPRVPRQGFRSVSGHYVRLLSQQIKDEWQEAFSTIRIESFDDSEEGSEEEGDRKDTLVKYWKKLLAWYKTLQLF